MVRKGGFEPPRSCKRQPLKLVRLPIPPLPHRAHTKRGTDQKRMEPRAKALPEERVRQVLRPAPVRSGREFPPGPSRNYCCF